MALDLAARLRRLPDAGPESQRRRDVPALAPAAASPRDLERVVPLDRKAQEAEARQARIAELRSRLDAFLARSRAELPRRQPRPAPPPLPGRVQSTAHGDVHVVEHVLAPDHCHGRTPIAKAIAVDPTALAALALDDGLAAIDPRRMLLLDTETTGLSGGTGGLAFLIGLAWFEDESLVVRQLLLRKPGQEAPMLHALCARLAEASALVTFNGKTFDWPLLRTRFVMNRLEPREPARHLDLLHCARRVFARRLEGVRLTALEEQVLGMRRERDLDGAEIPGAYLAYLRGNDDGTMARVLEHNLHDLVALAALVVALAERWPEARPEDDPRDQLSLARLALRARDDSRADAFARAAVEGSAERGPGVALRSEALELVARLARRRGDHATALAALRRALEAAPDDPAIHLALSKLCEHRLKDPLGALEHARRAAGAEPEEDHARRLARLERRLGRGRDVAAGVGLLVVEC